MSAVWSSGSRSPSVRFAAPATSLLPLSSLVYQSRAIAPFSDADLQRLVAAAQAGNLREGVTGLLVYDQGRFLQWLEGPTDGIGRIWRAILDDRRHTDIAVLGESTTTLRLFGGNAMALGKRHTEGASEGRLRGEIDLPAEMVETLYRSPEQAPAVLAGLALRPADQTLRALIDSVIVPELLAKRSELLQGPLALAPPVPLVIDPRASELARLLLAVEPRAAFALIDRLRADGRSIAQLCGGLFEPAARALGDLWLSDDCSEYEVTLGLGHLQGALRRASFETSSADVPRLPVSVPHAVLVAPSPREPHLLGSVIASEMFWRAGWDVRCEFPDSDAALNQLVHDRWFDVLDLSLSGAFTREHRIPAMAASIRAAHAHSLNPALTVIVDGRVFNEQPQLFADVGADASSASALSLVSSASSQRHRASREGEVWGAQ